MLQRIMLLSVHSSPLAKPGVQDTGGMNVYILNLGYEWCKRGIYVDIYTRSQDPSLPRITHFTPGGRVIRIQAGPEAQIPKDTLYDYMPAFSAGVIEQVAEEAIHYDIIYSHYWLSGLVALDLRTAWNIPIAAMFHTLGKVKNQVLQLDDTPEPQHRLDGEKTVMDAADLLVAPTLLEQRYMTELYGAEKRKIVIQPAGLDMTLFRSIPHQQAREAIGLPLAQPVILFVGRIQLIKGIDIVLEALACINQQEPSLAQKIALFIIGGDHHAPQEQVELNRFKAIAKQLGVEKQITLLEAQQQDVLVDYYNAATMLVMPSRYESFGMVAVEALACSTPVIATDVGGLSVIIKDGVNGYLVPANNAQALAEKLLKLLKSPVLCQQFSNHARRSVEPFSWIKIADGLLASFHVVS